MNQEVVYKNFEPHSRLQDYIRSYWYFRIKVSDTQLFDILPDGCFDALIVIREGKIVYVQLTGIWTKRVGVEYTEDTEIVGIRFKPLAVNAILKLKINELVDSSETVGFNEIGIEEEKLLGCLKSQPAKLANYLDSVFSKKMVPGVTDKRLLKLFELVEQSEGNSTVKEISESIGMGARQIHRYMNQLIGVGLKQYLQIVQFKKTMQKVKYDKKDYSSYFDQAHFIRAVKGYTGNTPDKMDLNENVRFIQYYNFNAE